MSRNTCLVLSLATLFLSACATDDSLPSRPRTAGPLEPSQKAQDNAAQRTMEPPSRQMPTSGREFPGQSQAPVAPSPTGAQVATLDITSTTNAVKKTISDYKIQGFSGPPGIHAFGHTVGPTTSYTRDHYTGLLPHLPENPGTIPQPGSTPAPDGDWAIDHSWGQGLTLDNVPHRAWPESTAYYKDALVKHNPVYYFNLQEHEKYAPQNRGTLKGGWISNAFEVPWFFVNTAMLPVLMALEPPLAQRASIQSSNDPNFLAHLPTAGDTVPAPYAGTLKWDYPFLNPDGTVKRPGATTQP